jgi:hypothetical protein
MQPLKIHGIRNIFFSLALKTDLQFIGLNNILENILKTRYNHMTCDTVVVFKV